MPATKGEMTMDNLTNDQLQILNDDLKCLCLKVKRVLSNGCLTHCDLMDIIFYLKVFQTQVRREQRKRFKLQLSK